MEDYLSNYYKTGFSELCKHCNGKAEQYALPNSANTGVIDYKYFCEKCNKPSTFNR